MICIDICAYAVMSNHYHVVLRVDGEEAEGLSDKAVIKRWMSLFKGSALTQRYLDDVKLSPGELIKIKEIVALWRTRLMDISWFMYFQGLAAMTVTAVAATTAIRLMFAIS